MNSSLGFEWRKSSNRLGLGKSNSDSLLDINGASTIRQLFCPAGFNGDNGGGGGPPTVPYYVDSELMLNGTGNYFNLPVPAAHMHGDLLLAIVHHNNENASVSASGWTLLEDNVSPVDAYYGYKLRSAILYRVANSSEPSSYHFNLSQSVTWTTALTAVYRNNDWTTPITASAANNGTHSTSTIQSPALAGSLSENHTILRVINAGAEGYGASYQPGSTTNGYTDRRTSSDDWLDIILIDKNGVSGTVTTESHNMTANNHAHSNFTIAIKGTGGGGGGGGGADYPGCAKENGGTSNGDTSLQFKSENSGGSGGLTFINFTFNVDYAPGIQTNDLMTTVIHYLNGTVITPPGGWTTVYNSNSGYYRTLIQTKIAGGAEGGSYTYTTNHFSPLLGYQALIYNGANLTSPITETAGQSGQISGFFNGNTYQVNLPSPGLSSFSAAGHTIVRSGWITDTDAQYMLPYYTTNGYLERMEDINIIIAGGDAFFAYDKSNLSGTIGNETHVLGTYFNTAQDYTVVTFAINPNLSSGGGSGNYTFPQSFTPDPNSMVMWQGIFDNNGDVGDVSAEINNSSIIKGFTIIDFDGIQNNQDPEFNGLTLNGLVANRLVITDSNKKLSTTSSVILNNNNVGISSLTPSSRLDVAALMTTKTFQIKSGAVNNYILRSDINGDSSWVAGSSVFNSAAGNDTEVQFNSAGVFAGNPNLTWASSRLNASNFSADNGSSSIPRYTFSGSNTSGVFSFSNNHLDYTSAGVHTISLDANGNLFESRAVELRFNLVLRRKFQLVLMDN